MQRRCEEYTLGGYRVFKTRPHKILQELILKQFILMSETQDNPNLKHEDDFNWCRFWAVRFW